MPLQSRLHTLVAAVAVPVLLACSFKPGESPFVETAEARSLEAELDDVGVRDVAPRAPADAGCEIVAHRGSCELAAVTAVDAPSVGDREVVAVYRALGVDAAIRIERRFRVSYLDRDEAEQIAVVRSHGVVACRWQTVLRGSCPAYPPEVEIPSIDEGDGATRSGRRHRHHGHHHHDDRAEHHGHHHRAEHGAHHHHHSEDGEQPSHHGGHRSHHHGEQQHPHRHHHNNG